MALWIRSVTFCRMALCVLGAFSCGVVWAQESSNAVTKELSLNEVVRRVLAHNETIQMNALDVALRRNLYQAEKGIFEPQVVGSFEHVDTERENTVQQQLSLLGVPVLKEENNIYNGGLEFLTPVGTRLRVGYTLRDLENNLGGRVGAGNRTVQEYESFVGASLTQPLLKNFGTTATMVRIRLAAVASDLAFQEYRRQLMLILSRAESAYWELYLTQRQEEISEQSVALARTILQDNQARVRLGRASDLEVLEAESGLALRETLRNEAQFKRLDAANRLRTLFSDTIIVTNKMIKAVDEPEIREVPLTFFENYEKAFNLNPDYLTGLRNIEQENIRVAYAKNQRLPQLDLKASYGLNGLGETPSESIDDIEHTEFPTWSVGVEMRIPMLGGIKEKNELQAAKLGKKRALVALKEIEVQIGHAIETTLSRIRNLKENIRQYESVADFYQKLLETQLARMDVGKIEIRTILETEEKLFEAKLSLLENMVEYRKALLQLELINGSVLQARNLDISKPELEEKTRTLLQMAGWSDREFEKIQRDLVTEYEEYTRNPQMYQQQKAQEALRRQMNQPRSLPADPNVSPHQKALEALRRDMEKSKR